MPEQQYNNKPENLKDISKSSGIYFFKNTEGSIIYIGKAKNLYSRVASYWSQHSWKDRPKLAILVPQIDINNIETIITANEKEALILEASLIYKHQPKYNVLLKDNKSFPWLAITYGESFPRFVVVRRLQAFRRKFPLAKFFGPYTDSSQMYKIYETVNNLFPLRKRANPLFKDRPCLNYHVNKCLAPCQQLVTIGEYKELLNQAELFIKGQHQTLLKTLEDKMQQASSELQFEKAGKYRDAINIIHNTYQAQRVITTNTNCNRDIIGIAQASPDDLDINIQLFKMRSGQLIHRESYCIDLNEYQDITESLYSIITQIYLMQTNNLHNEDDLKHALPTEILLPQSINEYSLDNLQINLQEFFDTYIKQLNIKKIKILIPKQGEKKDQINLALDNAHQVLNIHHKQKLKNTLALEELQDILKLNTIPTNIDCFDISHLQGTEVVASCVRLTHAQPNKSKYRKLKLTIDQNDDFYSMEEAVYRRYKNKINELPDLIIIDGGKGQLNAGIKAIEKLELDYNIPIISLAKRAEEVFYNNKNILIPYNSPALHTVQRARDEAHRFAVTYNRSRRTKSMTHSFLDNIQGIGQLTKQKITQAYSNLEDFKKAPVKELQDKLNITKQRAQTLWNNTQEYLNSQSI